MHGSSLKMRTGYCSPKFAFNQSAGNIVKGYIQVKCLFQVTQISLSMFQLHFL